MSLQFYNLDLRVVNLFPNLVSSLKFTTSASVFEGDFP